jgi:hypothetical protein
VDFKDGKVVSDTAPSPSARALGRASEELTRDAAPLAEDLPPARTLEGEPECAI